MRSIFASRKGRVAKKVGIFLATLSVIFLFINSYISGEQEKNQTVALEQAQQEEAKRPDISGISVYATDDEESPTDAPTDPSEEDEDQSLEEALRAQVNETATGFANSWINYDYNSPSAYSGLEFVPTEDGDAKKAMEAQHKTWTDGMKSRKELSSGDVTNVSIEDLTYDGTETQGKGSAVVNVAVTKSISNTEVGSAGSTVQENLKLTLTRNDSTGGPGKGWLVTKVETQ